MERTTQNHRQAMPAGYQLGAYCIKSILGEGSYGITYLAEDKERKQWVAIKEYLPRGVAMRETDSSVHPVTDDDNRTYEWGLKRFLEEGETLARLNHPNIVRVHETFRANNTAYMVMAYEGGETLDALFEQECYLGEIELKRLLHACLDALEHVHAAGFIHRDVKPANILVRSNGEPVLLDFGAARAAMNSRTRPLTAVVSPGFAPFEQYTGEAGQQGPWTDIYAMACTLYSAVSRQKKPTEAIVRGNARLLGKRDPLLPAALVGKGRYSGRFLAAVDAAMAFLPDERPQSVAVWRALFRQPASPATRLGRLWARGSAFLKAQFAPAPA